MALESHFGIKIKSQELDAIENVGDLVALIRVRDIA
jgi:acyl carrier protein